MLKHPCVIVVLLRAKTSVISNDFVKYWSPGQLNERNSQIHNTELEKLEQQNIMTDMPYTSHYFFLKRWYPIEKAEIRARDLDRSELLKENPEHSTYTGHRYDMSDSNLSST